MLNGRMSLKVLILGLTSGAILILGISQPKPAMAEVYNCDGKWTNKPCSGKVIEKLDGERSPHIMRPEDAQALAEKKSLFHEINMKNIEARRTYGIKLSLGSVEKICFDEKSTYADCSRSIDEFDSRLTARTNEAMLIRSQEDAALAQQRSNELQEEANRIQLERNYIEASKSSPNIVIINKNINRQEVPSASYRDRGVFREKTRVFTGSGNTEIVETERLPPAREPSPHGAAIGGLAPKR